MHAFYVHASALHLSSYLVQITINIHILAKPLVPDTRITVYETAQNKIKNTGRQLF